MSHSLRGRVLENAIARAGAAYRTAGRADLRKRPTPMRKIEGRFTFAQKAGCDFDGMIAGGRRLVLEAKLVSDGVSLPLDHFPDHQRAELSRTSAMGGEALVVVAFEELGETYAITWLDLHQAFFARRWRESIPLDVFRGFGLLVPDAPRHDPRSRSCLFLDGRPHVEAAAARARVEREASRGPRAVEDLDLSPAARRTAGPEKRSLEQIRAAGMQAISDFYRGARR